MIRLTNINDRARQNFVFSIDKTTVIVDMWFMPTQQKWFMSISDSNGFVLKNIQLGVSPNILRSYRLRLNYGLALVTDNGFDPRSLDDFKTDKAIIYVLNSSEVDEVEQNIYGRQV